MMNNLWRGEGIVEKTTFQNVRAWIDTCKYCSFWGLGRFLCLIPWGKMGCFGYFISMWAYSFGMAYSLSTRVNLSQLWEAMVMLMARSFIYYIYGGLAGIIKRYHLVAQNNTETATTIMLYHSLV